MKIQGRLSPLVMFASLWMSVVSPAVAQEKEAASAPTGATAAASALVQAALFATVNGKEITRNDFHSAYSNYLRQKFFHGQVPQAQLDQARQEVTDQLINRVLHQEEIVRRDIKPDLEDVEKRLQGYERRYASSPMWQQQRERLLPGLREQLSQQSQQSRLEAMVKNVAPPSPEQVKAYYDARKELFTEPEKLRLHSILLAVDPSSPRETWDAALREGQAIVKRIRSGASFSEQARLFSRDPSAETGGDMGYLHLGMMPDTLQAKLDSFKLGEVADPIEMLQGIGIFRLDERIPPKLQPFDAVAGRAKELLVRDLQEKAWSDLQSRLRSEAKIILFDSPATGAQQGAGK